MPASLLLIMALVFMVFYESRRSEANETFFDQRIEVSSHDTPVRDSRAAAKATLIAWKLLRTGQMDRARRILEARVSQENKSIGLSKTRTINYQMKYIRQMQLIRNCDGLGSKCLAKHGVYSTYFPPYRMALPEEVLREGPGCGREGKLTALVTRAHIRNSEASAIRRLRERATQGRVFSCQGPMCIAVIKTIPDPNRLSHGLSVCLVAKVGTALGAPRQCVEMYRKNKSAELFRAIVGTTTAYCYGGRPDFQLVIRAADEKLFPKILEQSRVALSSEPFRLQAEMHERYVLAVSDRRVSPILSGYREMTTVRVDVEDAGRDLGEIFIRSTRTQTAGATVSSDILVNRQNTDRTSDWHPASWSQQEAYTAAVKTSLKDKFLNLCDVPRWIDDRTLLCSSMHQ
jgi:hypothetical protein